MCGCPLAEDECEMPGEELWTCGHVPNIIYRGKWFGMFGRSSYNQLLLDRIRSLQRE